MTLYKRGNVWWYSFTYKKKLFRESAETSRKEIAEKVERNRRLELEKKVHGIDDDSDSMQNVGVMIAGYLDDYKVRHPGRARFAEYACGHLGERPQTRTARGYLGHLLANEVAPQSIIDYQTRRLGEKASATTINQEIGVLTRVLGARGVLLREEMKRARTFRLKSTNPFRGKAFTVEEEDRLAEAARKSRSPHIRAAHAIAHLAGLRDREMRQLQWKQIDMERRWITVGESKSAAGTRRGVPIDRELHQTLTEYLAWYKNKFGNGDEKKIRPEWYVFPFGRIGKLDPTKHVTTFKTAWQSLKGRAGVEGRWHDNRHTFVTSLKKVRAPGETILAMAGHASEDVSAIYTHLDEDDRHEALELVAQRRERIRNKKSEQRDSGQIDLRWLSFTSAPQTDPEFWSRVLQRIEQQGIKRGDDLAVRAVVRELEKEQVEPDAVLGVVPALIRE